MMINTNVIKPTKLGKSEKLPTFTDKYEEDLKILLFKEELKNKNKNKKSDIEESEYFTVVKSTDEHIKRNGIWDVGSDEEIYYFDPELSYELTGYRPINKEEGLDFKVAPFCQTGEIYSRYGKYTEYKKGSKPYSDFWTEELKRCSEGYTVGKYRVTGDHYFFLNFYRMKTVSENKKAGLGRVECFPAFHAKQYEYFHYIELCEYLYKDCVALKSRGVGFSEIAACLGSRPFITTRNFRTVYTAYTDTFVDAVLDKVWWQLNWLNQNTDGGMKRLRQKIDNIKQKRASLVDNEGTEYGRMAEIEGVPADKPRKLRGDRTDRLLYEEFGSNPISSTIWVQGTALVELGGVRVGIKIGWGTGGDIGQALAGLADIFSDPISSNVLPYKNIHTDDGKVQYTGFFIPAYCFMLIPEYIDERGVTDEVKARKYYEDQRKLKSGQKLLEYCSEYCFTPNEALLRQGENIFDAIALADRLTQLRIHNLGVKPKHVSFLWDENRPGKLKMFDNPNSKILIYEDPIRDDSGTPYNNLYIAGIDSIDQGVADSATNVNMSDFCIVIKKRTFGLSNPNYVCIYKDRPRDVREAYDITIKLLTYYNCKALLEHSKISIITYFREKKKDALLIKRPKSTLSDIKKGNSNMIGVPATETIIKHGLELINNFINDYCAYVHIDELLEQLLKYSYETKKKFDIVAAMGMAEIADEDMLNLLPRLKNETTKVWRDIGWYTDSNGNKNFGLIP